MQAETLAENCESVLGNLLLDSLAHKAKHQVAIMRKGPLRDPRVASRLARLIYACQTRTERERVL